MPTPLRLILVFSFMMPCSMYGQFNDSLHHHLRYGISGMINKTANGRLFVLNNGLVFGIKQKKTALNFDASWIYGIQTGKLVNNDLTSVLNLDLGKDIHRVYYWGLAGFSTSYSLRVRYQFQTGAGVGYNILKKSKAEIILSDGIILEAADLKTVLDSPDVYRIFRNSLRLKYSWKINDLVSLEGIHFWQPSLRSLDDYIVRSISGLSLKLVGWLSINAGLVYNKLARTNRENLLFNLGVIADRYY